MATTALLSTVVMGGLLLVVLALVLRLRHWQHPAPTLGVDPGTLASRVNSPLGWSVGFFVGTLLVTGLGMLYVAGEPVAGIEPATYGLALAVSLAVVFAVAAIVAVFGAVKSRGLNNAQAAGVSATLFFSLFLVAIVVQLFVGG
jgi:hypothetical protein